MEQIQTLEVLVKLASIGTAGVCVLSVFLIGFTIFKLPNDTPEWKPVLLKKFINACIIIALITAVSGSLNAYFNINRVAEADKATAEMVGEYEKLATDFTELQEVAQKQEEIISTVQPRSPVLEISPSASESLIQFEPRSVESILDQNRYQRVRNLQRDK
jgi:Zn-dependent protease with chaperone function